MRRAASDFTPNQRFFTQFLRGGAREGGGGEGLDNGVGWTISNQTPDSVRVSNERSHGFCSRGFVSKIINHERKKKKKKKEKLQVRLIRFDVVYNVRRSRGVVKKKV